MTIEAADQVLDVPDMPCPACETEGRVASRWRVFVDAEVTDPTTVLITPRRIECVVCEEGVDLYGREFTLGGHAHLVGL